MFLLLSHEKGQKKCVAGLESGATLVMKVAALLIMGGLVPVPALLATGVALGQDRTPLLQDAEMTTLLLQGERRHIACLLPGARQRSLMKIRSGDPIPLPVEMMLKMVMRRGRPHLTAMDPLRIGGLPRSTQAHLLDPAPGPPSHLPAVTDCASSGLHLLDGCSQSVPTLYWLCLLDQTY